MVQTYRIRGQQEQARIYRTRIGKQDHTRQAQRQHVSVFALLGMAFITVVLASFIWAPAPKVQEPIRLDSPGTYQNTVNMHRPSTAGKR